MATVRHIGHHHLHAKQNGEKIRCYSGRRGVWIPSHPIPTRFLFFFHLGAVGRVCGPERTDGRRGERRAVRACSLLFQTHGHQPGQHSNSRRRTRWGVLHHKMDCDVRCCGDTPYERPKTLIVSRRPSLTFPSVKIVSFPPLPLLSFRVESSFPATTQQREEEGDPSAKQRVRLAARANRVNGPHRKLRHRKRSRWKPCSYGASR